MGYSPGDFMIGGYPEQLVHWEQKDRYIVLWNDDESKAIVTLYLEQAIDCWKQLRTCIAVATGEDPA